MNEEWELMQKIADFNNSGNRNGIYELVSKSDFTSKFHALDLLITVMRLVPEEINKYRSVLTSFTEDYLDHFEAPEMDFRARIRFFYLIELLNNKELNKELVNDRTVIE
ncbi:hypothetical protein [Photobacterium leiognathi]|uniref:hypothetical protein n=1 Tax=Photobacterium leiognathi TaxID=553611 RepID=UPI002981C3B3|nr:hypothetical protein [Photobacterium leiognathi]